MKKRLLAASAAALVGGVAFAGSPVQAQEVEGFQLLIGGFYNAHGIMRDQDTPSRALRTLEGADVDRRDKIRRYDFSQYRRFAIEGSQTLDNGMTIGSHTEYEMQDGMSMSVPTSLLTVASVGCSSAPCTRRPISCTSPRRPPAGA